MRLLHVADLHLHTPWLDWVSSAAPQFDLVVVAGDTMNAFADTGLREQMKQCREWLVSIPAPTIVCSGNHDHYVKDRRVSVDVSAEGGWIRNLRGHGNVVGVDGDLVNIAGVTIAVAGWLRPRWPEAEVVVYHAPPSGCPCARSDGNDVGDQDAADQLLQTPPRIYLCGHVHEGQTSCWWPATPGGTLILVPGCGREDEPPAHWSLDFADETAMHSPSGERVELGPPWAR